MPKMTRVERSRTVTCPPPCGAVAHRVDTRKTTMPKLLRIRLYRCAKDHQFETAETIVGGVEPVQRAKKIINRYSVRGEEAKWRSKDYSL